MVQEKLYSDVLLLDTSYNNVMNYYPKWGEIYSFFTIEQYSREDEDYETLVNIHML